jgi:hypothetical protein
MLADHLLCVIDGARTTELAQLGSDISRAYANGALSEDDHQRLWEAIEERRAETRPKPRTAPSSAPRASVRRRQRSPDKQASIERRRRLAASGPMPPAIAAKFSTGELAVLKVVGDAVRHRGRCDMCMDEIAGRAGVCRRLAQMAIREAEGIGLLAIQERRLSATRNDTNVVTIISAEWLDWLRIGPKGGGCKSIPTTQHSVSSPRPRMVSGYRSKRLGEGGYRLSAGQTGGAKVAATSK